MSVLRLSQTAIVFCLITGCVSLDKDAASALALAGATASQAIGDQSKSANETVAVLPEWWGVTSALNCGSVSDPLLQSGCLKGVTAAVSPTLQSDLAKISDVLKKRAAAAFQLRTAYQSFGNLVAYNAGDELKNSLNLTFASINSLLDSVQTLSPGAAFPPISSTFVSGVGKVGGFLVDQHQKKQILFASKDLHTAVISFADALTVERNKVASESFLAQLAHEQGTLYAALIRSGLISPKDALAPLVSTLGQGIPISQAYAEKNPLVASTAAVVSFNARTKRREQTIISTYDASLAALRSLAAQHQKIEEGDSVSIESIIKDAQSITTDLQSLPNSK